MSIECSKCAICGKRPQLAGGEYSFMLHCCGLDTFHYKTQDGATLAWNEATKGVRYVFDAVEKAAAARRAKTVKP